jgi:hypothetical protein
MSQRVIKKIESFNPTLTSIERGKTHIRDYKLKADENFGFKNLCLLKSIKVKKPRECKTMVLAFNGVGFGPTSVTGTHYIFDLGVIREACRDSLGMTDQENDHIRIEEYFMYNSLKAMAYYKYLSIEELNKCVFTTELAIQMVPVIKTKIKELEVEEESWPSDAQLESAERK